MAALLLGLGSCTSEIDEPTMDGSEVDVQFVANLGDCIDSRAISDGTKANKLMFFVFEDGNEIPALRQTNVPVNNLKATVTTRLVKGHTYTFAFWAQNSSTNAYGIGYAAALDSWIVQVRYGTLCNDENRDAFYNVLEDYTVTQSFTEDVVLTRPLAQVNILASDAASVTDFENYTSHMNCNNLPYVLKFPSGDLVGSGLRSFNAAPLPTEPLPGYEQYKLLATAYFLAPTERVLSRVDFTMIYDGHNSGRTIENVPIQRNYRTNIIGDFLTNNTTYEIVIDPMYNGELGLASQWDGVSVEDPVLNETTGDYEVNTAAQLAGLAKMVDEGNTFSGKTVLLNTDVNLDNHNWTPIGPSTQKAFVGTFDGQGHGIYNLKVTYAKYGRGFFANLVSGAVVKNVTFDRATIGDRASGNIYGVVSGYAYGNVTFENVNVSNSTVHGYGKVGGILGMAADPGGTTTFKNCTVDRTRIQGTYNVGGIMGLAQNTTVLENCYVTNPMFVLDDSAADYVKVTAADGYTVSGQTMEGIWWKYLDGSDTYLYSALSLYYCDLYYEDQPINSPNNEGYLMADGLCHGFVDYQF